MAYKAPIWEDGKSPAISAENLNALSQAAEGAQVLYGNSAPTSSTKGAVGQFYLVVVADSDGNYPLYQCVAIANGSYVWRDTRRIPNSITSMLGIPAPGTINGALNVLANVGNVHVWSKASLKDTFVPILGAAESLTLSYKTGGWTDNIVGLFYANVDVSSGSVVLLSEQAPAHIDGITGLYYNRGDAVYFVSEVITYSSGKSGTSVKFYGKKVSVGTAKAGDPIGFATSIDSEAYPQVGDVGEYRYRYLGQLGDKTEIGIGSYVGTGTYGIGNKNKLTFPSEPKFVLIFYGSVPPSVDQYNHSFVGVYIAGSGYMWNLAGSTHRSSNTAPESLAVSASGNSIEWYSTYSQYGQLNSGGYTYNYIYGC